MMGAAGCSMLVSLILLTLPNTGASPILQPAPSPVQPPTNDDCDSSLFTNCIETDIYRIEELRSIMKNKINFNSTENISNLSFGLLEQDWQRLQLLENRLPDDSILKSRLLKVFRLLISAIYQVHRKSVKISKTDPANFGNINLQETPLTNPSGEELTTSGSSVPVQNQNTGTSFTTTVIDDVDNEAAGSEQHESLLPHLTSSKNYVNELESTSLELDTVNTDTVKSIVFSQTSPSYTESDVSRSREIPSSEFNKTIPDPATGGSDVTYNTSSNLDTALNYTESGIVRTTSGYFTPANTKTEPGLSSNELYFFTEDEYESQLPSISVRPDTDSTIDSKSRISYLETESTTVVSPIYKPSSEEKTSTQEVLNRNQTEEATAYSEVYNRENTINKHGFTTKEYVTEIQISTMDYSSLPVDENKTANEIELTSFKPQSGIEIKSEVSEDVHRIIPSTLNPLHEYDFTKASVEEESTISEYTSTRHEVTKDEYHPIKSATTYKPEFMDRSPKTIVTPTKPGSAIVNSGERFSPESDTTLSSLDQPENSPSIENKRHTSTPKNNFGTENKDQSDTSTTSTTAQPIITTISDGESNKVISNDPSKQLPPKCQSSAEDLPSAKVINNTFNTFTVIFRKQPKKASPSTPVINKLMMLSSENINENIVPFHKPNDPFIEDGCHNRNSCVKVPHVAFYNSDSSKLNRRTGTQNNFPESEAVSDRNQWNLDSGVER